MSSIILSYWVFGDTKDIKLISQFFSLSIEVDVPFNNGSYRIEKRYKNNRTFRYITSQSITHDDSFFFITIFSIASLKLYRLIINNIPESAV